MEFNNNFYSLKFREFYSAFLNQEILIVVVTTKPGTMKSQSFVDAEYPFTWPIITD